MFHSRDIELKSAVMEERKGVDQETLNENVGALFESFNQHCDLMCNQFSTKSNQSEPKVERI